MSGQHPDISPQRKEHHIVSCMSNKVPVSRETIQHLFACAVREHGGRTLLVSDADGSTFTYADAGEVVSRIMAKLAAEGVKKGDRICTFTSANAEAFLLFWATASLGAVYIPLDYNWPEKILERVLGQVQAKLLFCERQRYCGFTVLQGQVPIVLFDEPDAAAIPGAIDFSQWLESAPAYAGNPEVLPEDDALILFTSGSTGDPKGVVLSQHALYGRARLTSEVMCWTEKDRYFSQADIHAEMGLRAGITPLHTGASFLVAPLERRSNPLSLAECVRKYDCTQLLTVPVMLRQFVQFRDRISVKDLGCLRWIWTGGSTLTQELSDEFYEHFRVPVLNAYGMTEVGFGSTQTLDNFRNAGGSIGIPISTIEIVDEAGNILPDGVAGELRLRNDYLMTGYYQNPELTSRLIRNGWVYTGDLAIRRPDGHIVLTGRIKNIIKQASGELVCLEEVELALEKHPLVLEAAVCGFTAERGDERLAAFIVPREQPGVPEDLFRDLRRHLSREIGAYKVPAVFYLKDQLPRNTMGKVMREQLKKEITEQ